MKTKRNLIQTGLLCAVFSTLSLQLSTVFAQGTAFGYQGRLNDRGNPANGIYDLRFTIYDSTNNPGNVIAGPVTNSATPVTNGLFAVTLDFGAGVFSGPALWLQADVRTNGSGMFTTLSPRQPVLSVPYAIMANSASNLLGTLPAAQLSGTVPLAQLPATVVTNGATGLTLAGTFGGNGAGLTNVSASQIAFGTADETNLDSNLWMFEQASRLNDFQNVNRYSWTNAIAKLRAGKTIKIELDGTGLASWLYPVFLDYLMTNLCLPFAGCNQAYLDHYQIGYTFLTNSTQGGKDGNWYGSYLVLSNNAAAVQFYTSFVWDTIEVDYITAPDGGAFNILTNNGAGGPTNVALGGIGASGPLAGRSVFWTNNSGPRQLDFYFQNSGNGTNRIVNWVVTNSKITNGFIFNWQINSSSYEYNELAVSNSISSPIYRTWSPDIIFWQSIENTNTLQTYLPAWVSFYRTNCPNAGIVLIGTYPSKNADQQQQGQIIRSIALQNAPNVAYFDGFTPFGSTNTIVAFGWWADGVHDYVNSNNWGAGAFIPWAYWLYRWVDFADYWQ